MNFVKEICKRMTRKTEQTSTRKNNLQNKINPSTYTLMNTLSPSSSLQSDLSAKNKFYRWGNVSRLAGTTEFDNEKHVSIGSGLKMINDYPNKQGLAFDRQRTVKEIYEEPTFGYFFKLVLQESALAVSQKFFKALPQYIRTKPPISN